MERFIPRLKYRLNNQTPRWVVWIIDVSLMALSFLLSLLIVWQSEWQIGFKKSAWVIGLGSLVYIGSFLIFKPYKGIVRHTGLEDIIKILLTSLISFIFSIVVFYLIGAPDPKQNLILLVLHFLIVSNLLIFSRILYKHFYSVLMQPKQRGKNFLIYGAGLSGVLTYFALQANADQGNKVVAFVDDNPKLQGSRVKGLKVISPTQITQEWVTKEKIEEVIISIQDIRIADLNKIVKNFEGFAVKLRLVPLLKDWIDGRLEATQIQEVHIENLLGRNPIDINKEAFRNEVKDKVVLVTGAAGLVGTEISSHLLNYACKKIILVDQVASDLKKLEESWMSSKIMKGVKVEFIPADIRVDYIVDSLYNRFRPDIVYHADAYNKVLVMEENPYNAITVNIKGTRHLVAAASRYGVEKLVMVAIA